MNTQYNEYNTRTDKHALCSKLRKTPWVPLTKAEMTSLPVVSLTPNFLKTCVIKFYQSQGALRQNLCLV